MSKRITLAQIKQLHEAVGGVFFNAQTMAHFGETMKSFRVVRHNGLTYIKRVVKDRTGAVGQLWHFDPSHPADIRYVGKQE